jgi:uncharacterized protein YecE (DUF72 family)
MKLLGVGNDKIGLARLFKHNDWNGANKYAQEAQGLTHCEFGVKRVEFDDDQILAMLNNNIELNQKAQVEARKQQIEAGLVPMPQALPS